MTQDALRKRYTYLWTGEATAACVFAMLLLWSAYRDGVWQHWLARGYSVGVVIVILLQGIVWWRWKLRLLDMHQRHMPAHVLHAFVRWRRINWLLIGLFPLVVVLATRFTQQPLVSRDTWLGLLFLVGAVLEQINYYYVQLMYDSAYDWSYLRTHRRLRRGTVAKALDGVPSSTQRS